MNLLLFHLTRHCGAVSKSGRVCGRDQLASCRGWPLALSGKQERAELCSPPLPAESCLCRRCLRARGTWAWPLLHSLIPPSSLCVFVFKYNPDEQGNTRGSPFWLSCKRALPSKVAPAVPSASLLDSLEPLNPGNPVLAARVYWRLGHSDVSQFI